MRPNRQAIDASDAATRATAVIGAIIVILTALTPAGRAGPYDYVITDSWINAAVRSDFLLDRELLADWTDNVIDVATDHGIVTLWGYTRDLLSEERALRIAESVRGVRGVIDRIRVLAASRPDEDVRQDILAALLQDPATESYRIAVAVKDGTATLTGPVGSRAESKLAALVARGVKGLRAVHNELTVDYRGKRTDPEIAGDVNAALEWDIWLDGDSIRAGVKNGKVILDGTVGTALAKSRAVDDAWVIGVSTVDADGLAVTGWGPDDMRRRRYLVEPDRQVERAVESALRRDPRLSAFSPGVTVHDGNVVISGVVGNLKARIAAGQDAQNTLGARSVDNRLVVRPTRPPSDADIAASLRAALVRDPMLEGSQIKGAVAGGIALLSGSVNYDFERSEAGDDAARTKGVVNVSNHLEVKPEDHLYDYDRP